MSDEDDLLPPDEPVESEQDSAVDPKQRRDKVRKKKLTEQDSENFWRAVFESEIGRREMWRLLSSAKTFEATFACGPNGFPQSEATFYELGARDFGQRLYQTWLVRHNDQIALMHHENDARFVKPKGQ